MFKNEYYCRWCGSIYMPKKWTDRDGFCTKAHKQALHRAYKAYVTGKKDLKDKKRSNCRGVTQKKQAATKGIARATRDIGLLLSQNKRTKTQGTTQKCQT